MGLKFVEVRPASLVERFIRAFLDNILHVQLGLQQSQFPLFGLELAKRFCVVLALPQHLHAIGGPGDTVLDDVGSLIVHFCELFVQSFTCFGWTGLAFERFGGDGCVQSVNDFIVDLPRLP